MRCFIVSFALIMLKLAQGQNLVNKIPVFPDNIIGERPGHWNLLQMLACAITAACTIKPQAVTVVPHCALRLH
jgi:hypothetical protein